MSKSPVAIYQSKIHLFFGAIAVLLFAAMVIFWSVDTLPKLHGKETVGTLFSIGLVVVDLLFIAVAFMVGRMLFNSGKPIATVVATGITLRNGQTLEWNNIKDLTLRTTGSGFINFRTDLVIILTKGGKTLPYVNLDQERLADMIEEAKK